jgi:hypothetical protein
MSAPERLSEKASEYEILSAWHDERAVARGRYARSHAGTAVGLAVIAIVLREVAAAIEAEERER